MYYRKYFEGTVPSTETTKSVKFGGGTSTYTAYVNRSIVLGKAVEETLKAVGLNAYYDTEDFILYLNKLDKTGVGLISNNVGNPYYYVYDDAVSAAFSSISNSNSGYLPFSGINYKFYVSLIGEPTTLFSVAIGGYSYPATTAFGGITFGYGLNKKTEKEIFLYGGSFFSGTTPNFRLKNTDGTRDEYNSIVVNITFQTLQLNGYINGVVLKEIFDTTGMYTINDCYMGCKTLSAGTTSFYSINGVEYYCPNAYFIIKCPSKIIEKG
jgi:hypothetical protein